MAFEWRITSQSLRRALLGVVIGALVGGAVYLWIRPEPPFDGTVNPDRWQAVFLEDGRVYFGHLEPEGEDYYLLSDAFFIQERPGEEGETPVREVTPLSEEFQDPENAMVISADHVVLIENLRPDSEVTAAIERVMTSG